MNHPETVILTRYVRALCPQQKFDEYTPDAWHDVLGSFPAEEARTAATAIAARQPFVAPGEIVTEIRRARRDRMQRDAETEAPPVDPDDELAYRRALHIKRAAVATGREPTSPVPSLPAAPTDEPYMPADFRQRIGLGERAPELTQPCPQCAARPRQQCVTPRGRRRNDTHQARKHAHAEQTGATA